ncbi:MAG: TonB-dependent receptor [Candidatus Delongbacteria bacterium]|jgi:iron complex outermembrane receptor protein|nr:TonB-dependent receptor [Candidatus Delongbacteria bacterium]
MNNKISLVSFILILALKFSFCFAETELEVSYDSVGDSLIYTYVLEEVSYFVNADSKKNIMNQEISAREIQVKQPLNVADALKTSPDINTSTGAKGETNTKIRGFSSENILVLIDGIPINPGYYGKVDLSMIPTDNIAKIKILKGPAAVSYGTNNTGGVINIITKNGHETPQTKISGMFGDHEFQHLNINHSYKYKALTYWLSGYYQHRNAFELSEDYEKPDFLPIEFGGLRDNSFYKKWGTDVKLSYLPSDKVVYSFSGGYHSAEKEIPYASSSTYDPRFFYFPEWYRYHGSLSGYWIMNKRADLKGIITYDSYQNRLVSYKTVEFDDEDLNFDSWLKNYTLGTLWSGSFTISSSNEIMYGANTMRYFLKKADIGEPWLKRETQTINIYTDYLHRFNETASYNAGLALNSFYKDQNNNFDNYLGYSISGDFDLIYGIGINAGYAQTQSFPTMHQLYSVTSGNDDLKPEECQKYEIGLSKTFQFSNLPLKLSFGSSIFLNDLENMIDKQSATDIYDNIDAKIAGIETNLLTDLGEYISLELGYSHLEPYDFGEEMLYESPKDKINAGLKVKYKNMTIDYNFNYNGLRETENTRILPSYELHNINFKYILFKYMELKLKVDNIFDTDYEQELGFPAAGRIITAGFTFTM